MKKNKVILIGAINEGNVPTCGETMKNQLFVKRFNELFDEVITVDTLNWQKRPWILVKLFLTLLFNHGAKVIISASGAAKYLMNFLYYVPLKRDVYFWVVGGDFSEFIDSGFYNVKALHNLTCILVQGKSMVTSLARYGLKNVVYVPNSKPINFHPIITTKDVNEPYRFVFLSRVHPDKGIGEIIEATQILNNQGLKERFTVDFYGKIEPGYEANFQQAVSPLENVHYKGFLNLMNDDGYKTLSSYDVMLFPTYWDGEGFPGIVIDANIAGLPIIASDWNLNKEVIVVDETGYIIPVKDSKALAKEMQSFIVGDRDLYKMRNNCVRYISQYDYREVLSYELMKKINLL